MVEDVSIVLLITLTALALAGRLRVSFGFAGETSITTNVRATANTGGNNASGGNGSGGQNGAPGAVVQGGASASVEVHQTINGVTQPPVVVATSSSGGSARIEVNMKNDGQGGTVTTKVKTGDAGAPVNVQGADRRGTASGTGGGVPQNARGVAALRRALGELIAVLRSFSLSLASLFK